MPKFAVPPALIVTFAAGFGVAWGWKSRSPAKESDADGTVRTIAVVSEVSGTPQSVASPQAKADARDLVESPAGFLTSLNGKSALLVRSRVTAAVATMALDDVRNLAEKAETLSFSGSPGQWELVSAVFERWAELDTEGLLTKARETGGNRGIGWTGINAAFRQLALRDPEEAWARAGDIGPMSYSAKSAVLSTLGETDPARAIALALENGTSRGESWAAGSVMAGWLLRDRDAALAAFAALPPGEFRAGLTSEMAGAFAALDPDAALEWSRSLTNPAEQQRVISSAFERIASDDPQRALAMAELPEYTAQRRMAISTAVGAWARRDFDAAFAYTMESKRPADQQSMLQALTGNATRAQREKLLAVAGQFPPGIARQIYQSAINDYDADNARPQEILAMIDTPSLREDVLKSMLYNWRVSSEEVRDLFHQLQPTSRTTDQASNIARRLGYSDPEGALKWAESLGSADLRKAATTSALQTWAWSDPAAAAQHAAALTEPVQREEALRAVAQAWGPRDEKAALAWAQKLTGTDRSAALGALVRNAMQASPDQAVNLYGSFAASLDTESASKAENRGVARGLAQTLTENDPQQAIAWAQGLAGGPARHEAFAGIAEKWAGYDAPATSEWISSLPPGEGRDLAAEKLVSVIARDDPESAWAWALDIADRAKRREAAAQALQAWKAYGAKDTALQALHSAGFSPDEVQELSKRLD